jgi:hypothetical protein
MSATAREDGGSVSPLVFIYESNSLNILLNTFFNGFNSDYTQNWSEDFFLIGSHFRSDFNNRRHHKVTVWVLGVLVSSTIQKEFTTFLFHCIQYGQYSVFQLNYFSLIVNSSTSL